LRGFERDAGVARNDGEEGKGRGRERERERERERGRETE